LTFLVFFKLFYFLGNRKKNMMRDTSEKFSKKLCKKFFINTGVFFFFFSLFYVLFRTLLQVELHHINRLSLVMNRHVKFGKHFTSRFHSSRVWCYIHVRCKKSSL